MSTSARSTRTAPIAIAAALLLTVAPPLWATAGVSVAGAPVPNGTAAQAPAQAARLDANVRVEVTLTDQTGTEQPFKKSVTLVAAAIPRDVVGIIRSSIQVPVRSPTFTPSKEGEKEGATATPVVSYSYRNMMLNVDVRDVVIDGSRIRLHLAVEYSPVDEKTAEAGGLDGGMASFASFQQTLTLYLDDGKPLVVAQSSDPVPTRDRKLTLEAKATILK